MVFLHKNSIILYYTCVFILFSHFEISFASLRYKTRFNNSISSLSEEMSIEPQILARTKAAKSTPIYIEAQIIESTPKW